MVLPVLFMVSLTNLANMSAAMTKSLVVKPYKNCFVHGRPYTYSTTGTLARYSLYPIPVHCTLRTRTGTYAYAVIKVTGSTNWMGRREGLSRTHVSDSLMPVHSNSIALILCIRYISPRAWRSTCKSLSCSSWCYSDVVFFIIFYILKKSMYELYTIFTRSFGRLFLLLPYLPHQNFFSLLA